MRKTETVIGIQAWVPIILAALLSSGCISTHSYVDPSGHHASFNDLQRVSPPYQLVVRVQYELNGQERARAVHSLQDHAERSLRASGVAVPYDGTGTSAGELLIVANDVGSIAGAVAKGFGTGLTFGLVGSQVTDAFEITMRLTQGSSVIEHKYNHALISTVGLHSAPPGLTPVSPSDGFNQITDDVLLNFLKDVQAEGRLLPVDAVVKR
jgi:hypothetical protein